jgi:multidrug efflux pump subunit AcrA (membrane-fusion protein)
MGVLMKKTRNIHCKAGVVTAAVLLLFACTANPDEALPTPFPTAIVPETTVYTVQCGTVMRVLDARGRVSPVRQQELFFRVNGVVSEVFVSRGDNVRRGDILARLEEPERLMAEVAVAQLRQLQAQQHLEQLHLQAPVQAAEAQLALVESEIALEEARSQRARLDFSGVVDPLVLENARTELALAEQALENAQRVYDGLAHRPEQDPERALALNQLLDARTKRNRAQGILNAYTGTPSQEDTRLAEATLNLAEARYDEALHQWEQLKDGPDVYQVQLAQAALSEADSRLAIAERNLENNELRAPFDGEILVAAISPSSQVAAFRPVITIADPSELEIAFIPSLDEIQSLGIDQTVSVYLSNQPQSPFQGVIRRLPSTAITQIAGADSDDQSARVVLESEEVSLSMGELVRVIVHLEQKENVLWLPPRAIRTFQGFDYVMIQDGDIQRRVDVTLGLKSDDRVEILEGLSAGQPVIGP